ncbi:DUF2946 family protein [Polynucleobacter sp. MWH-UH2A]|uniref:DUF2946 family protein n=1 Tax=Polynucleobacter sp. MWH-UH2A TaxID=1855617 RepID=UPI001BFD2ABC|nr:DUF2946 family protein [Polynucleobacter sp. MWH-UH2A]QWD63829.1 DUF2946 family protein [Polynucleobacter sp. MWH-UH2A]
MDEQVLRSLIKWPNVPDCYGWLSLDRRGQWRMRDEFAQQNGLPGQVIEHTALKEFIYRNYACDDLGRYFFQNGPQRVFISLSIAPWIARIIPSNDAQKIVTQCHTEISPTSALSDEQGNIYIAGSVKQSICIDLTTQEFKTEDCTSVALLHDHDLDQFSELAKLREEACSFGGSWNWQGRQLALDPIHSSELSERFGFIKDPEPL